MDRRTLLKSVGGTVLMPTISVPSPVDTVPFDKLDSMFADEYTTAKSRNEVLGDTYSAVYEQENRKYNAEYRAFSQSENIIDVRVNNVDDIIYEHYYFEPQNHIEAWTFMEIARKRDVHGLKELMKTLEIDSVRVENE